MSDVDVLSELEQLRTKLDDTLRAVAARELPVETLLTEIDDERSHLYAVKAIEVVEGVGKVRARRLLEDLGLTETVRIAELSAGQRRALIDGVRSFG